MIIVDPNQVHNYTRYHIRDIHKTVRELTPERRELLLNQIQEHKIACDLLGKEYDQQSYDRIESLLNGKRPKTR